MAERLLVSAFAEDSAQYKSDIGRPLAKPPHEIGEPLTPKRDVHAHEVAPRDERGLKVASNSIQHLELEPAARDAAFGGVGACLFDEFFVVSGDGRIRALIEEQLHQPPEGV